MKVWFYLFYCLKLFTCILISKIQFHDYDLLRQIYRCNVEPQISVRSIRRMMPVRREKVYFYNNV